MAELHVKSEKRLDIEKVRADFPVLHQEVYGKPLIYFDNAASSQRPKQVTDAIKHYYDFEHSNVHRGVHYLSDRATNKFEESRRKLQAYINARYDSEIIFTKGTTEGINLVAYSFGELFIEKGDEILITTMEHHANIVPWQLLAKRKGAKVVVAPINQQGEIIWEEFESKVTKNTKLIAVNHVSNALGTINPIEKIISLAKSVGAYTLIDGAQSAPHMPVDVQALDCDFYVFSGHKMCGPTGTGVLYGKKELLDEMPPYQSGGEMIKDVSFEGTTFNDTPFKFEAGTPNIAGVIGLGAAVDYVTALGLKPIKEQEDFLVKYATTQLKEQFKTIKFYGEAKEKASVVSFLIGDAHPYDTGTLLDKMGIAVRTGHHCTQPLMKFYNIPGTVRASFSFYNTKEEIDSFIQALHLAVKVLS